MQNAMPRNEFCDETVLQPQPVHEELTGNRHDYHQQVERACLQALQQGADFLTLFEAVNNMPDSAGQR